MSVFWNLKVVLLSYLFYPSKLCMTRKYWEDEDYFLIQANLIACLEFCKGFIIVEVKKNAGKYPNAAF